MVYFKGQGYSSAFSLHMAEVIEHLKGENPSIQLTLGWDEICSACPNRTDGSCAADGIALRYDKAVLTLCEWQEGEILSARTFFERVQQRILSAGKRGKICTSCQWNSICSTQSVNFSADME